VPLVEAMAPCRTSHSRAVVSEEAAPGGTRRGEERKNIERWRGPRGVLKQGKKWGEREGLEGLGPRRLLHAGTRNADNILIIISIMIMIMIMIIIIIITIIIDFLCFVPVTM